MNATCPLCDRQHGALYDTSAGTRCHGCATPSERKSAPLVGTGYRVPVVPPPVSPPKPDLSAIRL